LSNGFIDVDVNTLINHKNYNENPIVQFGWVILMCRNGLTLLFQDFKVDIDMTPALEAATSEVKQY